MKKKMVCALMVGMVLCMGGCAGTKEQAVEKVKVENRVEEKSEEVESAEVTPEPTATPEPFKYDIESKSDWGLIESDELFTGMSFTIEGTEITMPCRYSDLMDAGFFLTDYYGYETTVEDYIKYDAIADENGMVYNQYDLNVGFPLKDDTDWDPLIIGYVEEANTLVDFRELNYTNFHFDNQHVVGCGVYDDLVVGNDNASIYLGEDYKDVMKDYGEPAVSTVYNDEGVANLYYHTVKNEEGRSYALDLKFVNGKLENIAYWQSR